MKDDDRKSKRARAPGGDDQDLIAQNLRALFQGLEQEALPERIEKLLDDLSRKDKT